jgi:hypothetical protein
VSSPNPGDRQESARHDEKPVRGVKYARDRRGASARGRSIRLIPAMTDHPGLLDADRVRTSFRSTEAWTAEERLDDLIDGYVNWRESACAV